MSTSRTQLRLIPLMQNRSLLASFSKTKKNSKQWIVFVPGSASSFSHADRKELESLVGARIAPHFHFLVINKPGLSPKRTDRDMFERSFLRARRIEDTLTALKLVVPRGHSVHIVGYSEGAYLAPQIARHDKRIKTVSMIGGGTRGWLKEELNTASPSEKSSYARKIAEIHREPHSRKKWNGFTYATWYSYRADNTLQALRKLQLPTLAILGARDRVIDLRSAIVDLVLISERRPVQINIFGDCGHHFTKHWPQVALVLGRFLSDNVLSRAKRSSTR